MACDPEVRQFGRVVQRPECGHLGRSSHEQNNRLERLGRLAADEAAADRMAACRPGCASAALHYDV